MLFIGMEVDLQTRLLPLFYVLNSQMSSNPLIIFAFFIRKYQKILFSSCFKRNSLFRKVDLNSVSGFVDSFEYFIKFSANLNGSTPTFRQLFLNISAKARHHTSETVISPSCMFS
jgi:hypothetical protein